MNTKLHPQFIKSYDKRIAKNAKLVTKVLERLALFKKDPSNPLLKDHSLTGKKSHLRAFWVTGDIRIVYLPISEKEVIFIDIGSHNQVY